MSTRFTTLLDEFRQLPRRPERLPTLMEVAGYPHYENVCSNILAFFLDPGRPHGLGTLFLDAVAQTGAIQDQGKAIDSNVSVEREAPTDAGNRIDILIQSDSHVILIENKIFAGAGNPFHDYAAHAEELKPAGGHVDKFLLTLTPNDAGAEHGFRNVTHGRLVHAIRELLGHYVAGANTRYLTFMLDFLNTLDNLQRGMAMNPEFVRFLAENYGEVEDFWGKIKEFQGELRSKVAGLQELIDVNGHPDVRRNLYREGRHPLCDVLVYQITNQDFVVQVDAAIYPSGWEIDFFPRKNTPDNWEWLQELIQVRGIPVRPELNEDGRFVRFVHQRRFEYGADMGEIAQVVQSVVNEIARHGMAAS